MLLTDIREVKGQLDIDPNDSSEDKKLLLLIEQASSWIEQYLNRNLEFKSRTEYYQGSGTQRLQLRSRPVLRTPTPQVWIDETAFFGSVADSFGTNTEQTYGTHFALDIDQEDGTSSRNGILVRINNLWPRPQIRQRGLLSPFIWRGFGTIRVTYTAGFSQDTLPAPIRLAANILIAQLRQLLPLGFLLSSESYEERSIAVMIPRRKYLLDMVEPMLLPYRNWYLG